MPYLNSFKMLKFESKPDWKKNQTIEPHRRYTMTFYSLDSLFIYLIDSFFFISVQLLIDLIDWPQNQCLEDKVGLQGPPTCKMEHTEDTAFHPMLSLDAVSSKVTFKGLFYSHPSHYYLALSSRSSTFNITAMWMTYSGYTWQHLHAEIVMLVCPCSPCHQFEKYT